MEIVKGERNFSEEKNLYRWESSSKTLKGDQI